MTNSTSPILAIAAIFKNEGPYILEWLAFHRAVGIDRFFIADNDSTDGSSELLAALEKIGIITLVPFPSIPGVPPQLPAYQKIIDCYANKADWFAFIDADEFIYPTCGDTSVKTMLNQISEIPDIGAIAINWAIYGSSNQKNYNTGLVISRFTKRAPQEFGVNQHFKSMVRTTAYESIHRNPHIFNLKENFRYIQSDGNTLRPDTKGRDGLSEDVCWRNLRLNHYIVKSQEEFALKKSRGRATVSSVEGLNRTQSFFNGHDRNDVTDTMAISIIDKTDHELTKLKYLLGSAEIKNLVIDIPFPKAPQLLGCVDTAKFSDGNLEFTGWAFFDTLAHISFHISINNHLFDIDKHTFYDRPDVQRAVSTAPLRCGFKVTISISKIPKKLLDSEIELNASTTGAISRILPGAGYSYPNITVQSSTNTR
ncbi:glycosyltransferase family 2 protein [Pseudomonas fulva]|uniref:Glycosyltransferase family 2 protein n=1 Tax=Pseudomonas fulva TaxID=47880 RepID=A0A7S9L8B4_9PSED|nr:MULTISPECIES: glycosyltransferase family 2 protein [Pseudomonas]MBA6125306.1 glycosyltransferase family 2 protein [Pseudomonas juntendi]QPH44320.1 glycosyltransferase family 2 protein [Pseudomonas fulva]QPH49395.1 glycosyltransferase family 2 protein [Pseudomonas fulva]